MSECNCGMCSRRMYAFTNERVIHSKQRYRSGTTHIHTWMYAHGLIVMIIAIFSERGCLSTINSELHLGTAVKLLFNT